MIECSEKCAARPVIFVNDRGPKLSYMLKDLGWLSHGRVEKGRFKKNA
jgi:hypothetical protein